MKERRTKLLLIEPNWLTSLLCWKRQKFIYLPTFSQIDWGKTEVLGVWFDWGKNSFSVRLYCKDWEIIEAGVEEPILQVWSGQMEKIILPTKEENPL